MLDFLASLDVSGKLDALIRGLWFTARGRGVHCTTFAPPPGSSPADLERLLARRGVAVFGRGIQPGGYDWGGGLRGRAVYLHHSARQTRWVEYVLSSAGAVILAPSDLASVTAGSQRNDLPPAWADKTPALMASHKRAEAAPSSGGRVKRAVKDLW